MSFVDWALVVLLNGSVIVYALLRGRDTHSSSDWFLAGRSLPWWLVGLSLYATAIDSTDLVVDAGAAYGLGLRFFVVNWIGVVLGWFLLANFVAIPMYRAGLYTNAEYLEARFGVTPRIVSVAVQVLYRTVIIGMIGTTNYLSLVIICDFSPSAAWTTVGLIALLATGYTMLGGLKSVVVTDALQSVIMLVASVILFVIVWNAIGGFAGVRQRLGTHDPELVEQMLRVGGAHVEHTDVADHAPESLARQLLLGGTYNAARGRVERRTPAWLVCLSLMIAGVAYAIVNHTQTMRLFGARSETDLRLAIVPAGLILLVVTFLNLSMGVLGKALYPETGLLPVEESVQKIDAIYPVLVRDFTFAGLTGIVMAGILAAAFSTYDSIGSTLSALITRDIYARLFVTDRDDRHYLTVGRWLTPAIIFGSFLYVPALLAEGMIFIYLKIVGAFVVPLLTVYLLGCFTRVHRGSASVGLFGGVGYGLLALLAPTVATHHGILLLPTSLLNPHTTAPVTLLVTATLMLVYSMIRGWEREKQAMHTEAKSWLRHSQRQLVETAAPTRSLTWPSLLGLSVVALGLLLTLLFW